MRKRTIFFLVIVTGYFLSTQKLQGQSGKLDLKKATMLALKNNRSLRADSFNIPISEDKNRQLAAAYQPQVNYVNGVEYNPAIPSQMLPGKIAGQPDKDFVSVQFGTRYNLKSGVELTQTIFRKDLKIQIKAAGLQTAIARTKYSMTREELVYQVAGTYYALQTNAETIRNTHLDYLNLENVLKIAKAQYEAGVLKRIEYESLQINVANKLSYLNQLQTTYNNQLAFFNYLLGVPASDTTEINDVVATDLQAPEIGNSLSQRMDLRLSAQMITAKEAELKSIQAEKLPAVSSYFRYNYQSQFNDPGKAFSADHLYNSSTIGITVSIPILDGNRRRNRASVARTELEQLKLKKQHLHEEAKMELFNASSDLNNNYKEYHITGKNLELAIKVFNSRKALYTEGVTTLMELLDSERELSQARNQHMQALINVQIGRLDVHKTNGTLLTEFLKSI